MRRGCRGGTILTIADHRHRDARPVQQRQSRANGDGALEWSVQTEKDDPEWLVALNGSLRRRSTAVTRSEPRTVGADRNDNASRDHPCGEQSPVLFGVHDHDVGHSEALAIDSDSTASFRRPCSPRSRAVSLKLMR